MISVQYVNKSFGNQLVLKDINFEISRKEIVGFLGPNGAGKSTTMKIITGYLQADAGQVFVNGQQISKHNLNVRSEIGYLPEHNPLYIDMYVKEYLFYVSGIYKLENKTKCVNEVIEQTGLGVEQNKKIRMLSKGYRQRVGIAQAIIHKPSVLILDEPTSGLDPNQIIEVRNLIAELGREKTVMLSTHIMQEVEAMCQRVLILNQGTIVEDSLIDSGLHSLKNEKEYQVEFEGLVSSEIFESVNEISLVGNEEGKFIVRLKENASPTSIFDFAVSNGLKIQHLSKKNSSVEGLFRNATVK